MTGLLRKTFVPLIAIGISACSQNTAQDESLMKGASSDTDQNKAVVSFKLVDAPNKELKSVIVDIDHMEVLVAGKGKNGRLILAQGLGAVDLLKLQNGVSLPLQDIQAPAGIQIQQIRLILKDEGHYAVKGDDSVCELKTPSAQKTGVKIILTNKIQFEAGNLYNIIVDFDALKSVVIQGNGGCLLKPVLKLKSAIKIPLDPVPPVVDDGNGDGGGSGDGDGGGSVENPPVDSGTDPADNGEELVTTPDENDPSDDGWDYTPIVDGQDYPVITEDQLDQLL
ncbi:hypothetical protein D3C87_1432360 [compost metagenome]